MPWTTITEDHLRAAGHGNIVDQAREQNPGGVDPVGEAISSAVARVRRAVSAGNAVDVDLTKVPDSLRALTVRLSLFALMELIGFALSEDQRDTKRYDQKDLDRLADRKILVEAPDEPDTTGSVTPSNRGSWNSENKIVGRTHPVPAPGRQYPPGSGAGYANPDAPLDGTT